MFYAVVVEKVGEPLQRDANGKIVKDASSKNGKYSN